MGWGGLVDGKSGMGGRFEMDQTKKNRRNFDKFPYALETFKLK